MAAPDVTFVLCQTAEELFSQALDADALIYWPFRAPLVERFFEQAPNLKWVHVFTAGVDSLKYSTLCTRDIRLSCTKGIHGIPIAEHVITLALAMMRRLPQSLSAQRRHIWAKSPAAEYREAAQMTLGVVGVGLIGQEVVRKAKACGFHVIGADLIPVEIPELEILYQNRDLDKMLEQCDIVVLTCPLTDSTYHLIDEKRLHAMKPGAFLINVSRGAVVDDDALIAALRENRIGGAALDALTVEPLPEDSPYWDMDQVILTPHVAAYSAQYMNRAATVIAGHIRNLRKGEPLPFEVDRQALWGHR